MSKAILVTRPEYDYTTRFISAWAVKVIDFAKSKGTSVFDLSKERATKREFESIVEKKHPRFIFLNGHGDDRMVTGQDEEVLVKCGENEKVLKSRIVYALSCRSAKELGPESVASGADAYIGYDEDFIFMYRNEKRLRPTEDKTAAMFLESSNQVAMSLLKGNSAQASHLSSRRAFIRSIQKLLTSKVAQEDSSAVRYLVWDMQHQVCLGDQEARI